MTISVCLIVKDEQEVIGRCLSCAVLFADEIVVVDTGSTDDTVTEAKKYTDNVYFFEWCDDFSAARNFAFGKATGDFVMWIDADDVITEDNCKKIAALKKELDAYDMVIMPYAAAFDGDKPTFVYDRERIFRRSKNYKFAGAVHEAVTPSGRVLHSDAVIYHKKVKENAPLRNLNILQKLISKGVKLDERQKFYYGRELLFNGMYLEAAAVFEDFLKGGGWIVNKCEACFNLYQAYKELGENDRAISALLRGFTLAPPDSRACCIMGGYFMEKGEYSSAKYWYEAALTVPNDERSGGFINLDYCGFIPNMQLCVIYDRLGEREKACSFNEEAGRIKPDNSNYLSNKKYFEKLGVRGKNND